MNAQVKVNGSSTARPDGDGRTVLLVDTDPAQRDLSRACLKGAGFAVSTAARAVEAIEVASRRRPDVVVSDVVLGDMDGFALCRALRSRTALADVPVVLVGAAFHDDDDKKLASAAGANALAERSDDFSRELDTISRVLGAQRAPMVARKEANDDWLQPPVSQRSAEPDRNPSNPGRKARTPLWTLLGNLGSAVAMLDSEGIIVDANAHWETILRMPRSKFLGCRLSELAEPVPAHEDVTSAGPRTQAAAALLRVIPIRRGDGTVAFIELSNIRAAGEERTVVFAIARDLTDTIVAFQELEREEASLRAVFEGVPATLRVEGLDGAVRRISSSVEALCGYPAASIVESAPGFWLERVHPEDLPRAQEAREAARRSKVPVEVEYRWQRKDGTWCWLLDRAALTSANLVCGVYTDISERKRSEERARRAPQLQAVGQLSGGVAHDFNNIVAAILASSHFLITELPETDPRRIVAEEIKTAANRAATLTQQLLAFSRRQVIEPAKLNLNAILAQCEGQIRKLAGPKIAVALTPSSDLGAVLADAAQLEQVLMSLVSNSREAMPDGGELRIETANVDLDDTYVATHIPAVPGGYVRLAISDTGCGMDADTRAKAFEPYFTTKERATKSGLGLSSSYGIVKQSGGYIWLYSEPGHGTVVKIYLPRVSSPASLPAPVLRKAVTTLTGHETILLVDDDVGVRSAVQRMLSAHGYRVITAGDGPEAIRVFDAQAQTVDLILSDVTLPGQNGPWIVGEITARSKRTRAILMSGYADQAVARECVLPPGTNFIQKPFAPDDLARKVREVLDG